MKRTSNLSVYKLLGYLLLGIGAYAVFNANNTNLQATAPVTQQQTTYKQNRHTITLVLNQLSDLKVEEGQRVNVGDIISDRTSEKAKLQAKKQRLQSPCSISLAFYIGSSLDWTIVRVNNRIHLRLPRIHERLMLFTVHFNFFAL